MDEKETYEPTDRWLYFDAQYIAKTLEIRFLSGGIPNQNITISITSSGTIQRQKRESHPVKKQNAHPTNFGKDNIKNAGLRGPGRTDKSAPP